MFGADEDLWTKLRKYGPYAAMGRREMGPLRSWELQSDKERAKSEMDEQHGLWGWEVHESLMRLWDRFPLATTDEVRSALEQAGIHDQAHISLSYIERQAAQSLAKIMQVSNL